MMFIRREDVSALLGVPFSEEQLDAICAPLAPQVIVAGAGTGKTTVMAARVVWLVGTGQLAPEQVLGLTFTRKAAGELAARIEGALVRGGLVPEGPREVLEEVLTYDAFAGRVLQEHGIRLGHESFGRMLTGASRFRLAERVVEGFERPLQVLQDVHASVLPERILALESALGAHLTSVARVREFTAQAVAKFDQAPLYRGAQYKAVQEALAAGEQRAELLDLVEAYRRLKADLGLVEFADQLAGAVEVARSFPAVRQLFQARFKVVLLDEYQDTSAAQVELLRTLFSGPSPAVGRGFPVTAVGDPNQAIYGWRGAAATTMADFPAGFRNADGSPAHRWSLTINRRSGTRILKVGNALAAPLRKLESGDELVAPDGARPGVVEARSFDTEADELDALAGDIVARNASGIRWGGMAVLTRRNELLGKLWRSLRDRDIPVEIVGLGGLLLLPEIAPVVATLRVIADPLANPEVAGLLTGERWRLGHPDLQRLAARAKELAGEVDDDTDDLAALITRADPARCPSLLDAAADPGEGLSQWGADRVRAFAAEIADLTMHRFEPVTEIVGRVIARLGVETELLISGDASQLARFRAACASYLDLDGVGSLDGLLAWLTAEATWGDALERELPSEEDSVKLLSVHRSKGLEWDVVYLPALSEGTFPGIDRSGNWTTNSALLPGPLRGDASGIPQLVDYSRDGIEAYKQALKKEHLLAEDRLAYVAATRARNVLIASRHTWSPGRKRPLVASRYFTDALELADRTDVAEPSPENPQPIAWRRADWPPAGEPALTAARQEAAALVAEAVRAPEEWVWGSDVVAPAELERIAAWDADAAFLAEQASRREAKTVLLPDGLSASALMELTRDPQTFAERLACPMPREPKTEALLGERFHDWVVSRFDAAPGFEELVTSGAPDPALERLKAAFEASRYAGMQPLGVEVPFLLNLDGLVLRGRIDAVFPALDTRHDALVIDWKIGNSQADPLQLAIYRQAWAEANGLDVDRVAVAFHHVLAGRTEPVALSSDALAQAVARLGG